MCFSILLLRMSSFHHRFPCHTKRPSFHEVHSRPTVRSFIASFFAMYRCVSRLLCVILLSSVSAGVRSLSSLVWCTYPYLYSFYCCLLSEVFFSLLLPCVCILTITLFLLFLILCFHSLCVLYTLITVYIISLTIICCSLHAGLYMT